MGMSNASHIETGFSGWQSDGLDVATFEEWQASRED